MAEDITEEEQIEALKRWWAENGMQTVLAVV
ncbi:MAG: putative negative regulator of RcsB-dependent stress response, partial [Porticoccaceae bacterium]